MASGSYIVGLKIEPTGEFSMSKLPETLYLPEQKEMSKILIWGKSPELAQKDIEAGMARLGGFRTPSYEHAYVLAANTLLRTATEERTLDHHSLPIFFLQRHATELLIKKPLELGILIQKYREDFGRERPVFPSGQLKEPVTKCHDLQLLYQELKAMVSAFQLSPLPIELEKLVDQLVAIEDHHTWARYSYRHFKNEAIVHINKEVTIPLRDIQEHLQAAADALGEIYPEDDRLNGVLSSIFGEFWAIEGAMMDEEP